MPENESWKELEQKLGLHVIESQSRNQSKLKEKTIFWNIWHYMYIETMRRKQLKGLHKQALYPCSAMVIIA